MTRVFRLQLNCQIAQLAGGFAMLTLGSLGDLNQTLRQTATNN